MKTITVDVTREDIRRGAKYDNRACPVALAITRLVGVHRCVSVGFGLTWILAHRMDAPKIVRDFVVRFDGGDTVEPISFPLEIPDRIPLVESPR